jgi:hypothetical protein
MSESVDRVMVKIQRAEAHIESLKEAIHRHLSDHYRGVDAQINAKPETAQVRITGSGPTGWAEHAAITGDAVHNLRAALDHIAWLAVESNGGTPTDKTCFPILKVPPTPDKHGHSKPPHISGGVAPAVAEVIRDFQPYTLCPPQPSLAMTARLHELDIEDKHHGLLFSSMHVGNVNMDEPSTLGIHKGVMRFREVTDEGADYVFVPDNLDPDVKATLSIAVCLGPGTVSEHKPVAPLVRDMARLVRDILTSVSVAANW